MGVHSEKLHHFFMVEAMVAIGNVFKCGKHVIKSTKQEHRSLSIDVTLVQNQNLLKKSLQQISSSSCLDFPQRQSSNHYIQSRELAIGITSPPHQLKKCLKAPLYLSCHVNFDYCCGDFNTTSVCCGLAMGMTIKLHFLLVYNTMCKDCRKKDMVIFDKSSKKV